MYLVPRRRLFGPAGLTLRAAGKAGVLRGCRRLSNELIETSDVRTVCWI